MSLAACSQCCCVFSASGICFLVFVGILLQTEPCTSRTWTIPRRHRAAVLHWRCVCSPFPRARDASSFRVTCARQSAGIYAAFVVYMRPASSTAANRFVRLCGLRPSSSSPTARAQDSKLAGEAKREETVSLKQGRLRAEVGYEHPSRPNPRKCTSTLGICRLIAPASSAPNARAPTPTRAHRRTRATVQHAPLSLNAPADPARACASSRRP